MSTRGTTTAKRQRELEQKDRAKDRETRRAERRERRKTSDGSGAEVVELGAVIPELGLPPE